SGKAPAGSARRAARRAGSAWRSRHRLLSRRRRPPVRCDAGGARVAHRLRRDRQDGCDRRRCPLHGPHRACRDRGSVRLRSPRAGAACGAGRPWPSRAADQAGLCRQEPADLAGRARACAGAGDRRRRGGRDRVRADGGAGVNHLLSIEDLDREAIERIVTQAARFAEGSDREIKKVPAWGGRMVLNLFYEASTRTRSSFELAAKRLSADVVNFAASGSSGEKGESLKDTVLTLSAHKPDAIVVRTPWAGAAELVSRWCRAAIVNAGDGKHEHPTQALLDVYTLRERLGGIDGASIWIVGDVAHSRVARSNIIAFQRMGASVTVAGPPTLIPRGIEALGCDVRFTLDELACADVVYALRMQHERMNEPWVPSLREYAAWYQINAP